VRLALLLAAAFILVRDPTGKWAGDPLQPWFQALKNKNGLVCCAEADGQPLDESEWDMKGDSYRVFLKGKWTVVPHDALILGPNKFGKAIVWIWPREVVEWADWNEPGFNFIRCFIPGSGV
jgi:hypothetical protein